MSNSLIFLITREVVHQVQHQLFQDHAQASCPNFATEGLAGNGAGGVVRKQQAHTLILEEPLVLLEDGISGLGENLHQRSLIELVENSNHRQASDEFRDKAELDQILGLSLAQKLGVALCRQNTCFLGVLLRHRLETQGLLAHAPRRSGVPARRRRRRR